MKITKKDYIDKLSNFINCNNTDLLKYISLFEKNIYKGRKKYDDYSGLEDIKMNKFDYYILYNLYKNTSECQYKLHILLLFIYSVYKLDSYDFDNQVFPLCEFFDFLNINNSIYSDLFILINAIEK